MARTRRDSRRSGLYPLAYMGVEPIAPPLLLTDNRAPTPEDRRNFDIGTIWIDRSTAPLEDIWMLVNLDGNVARWLRISQTAATALETITGNIGLAVPGDGANNINVIGAGPYVITGNPATNTLTLTDNGTMAREFVGDVGSAFPIANVLNIWGGTNINTTGVGQTITVNLDNDVSIPGTLTLPLLGAGVVQTTAAGLFFSNNGANGQVLIGGGAAPAWANITSAGGTIVVTNGPNAINIDTAAGGIVLPGDNININPANTVNLNETIHWPHTNAAGTQGMIYLGGGGGVGGNRFMHNYGAVTPFGNTFLGELAGNLTLSTAPGTAQNMVGIGDRALRSITTGNGNTCVGGHAGEDITTGNHNTLIGDAAGSNIIDGDNNIVIGSFSYPGTGGDGNVVIGYDAWNGTTGDDNIVIGRLAGATCTGTEADNIFIQHTGVLGANNEMHIGTHGNGAKQVYDTWIAGIYNRPYDGATDVDVRIDANHKLGTYSSSIKVKENVKDMGDVSSHIMKLRPVTFNYIDDDRNLENYGLIAEEVDKINSRLVAHDKEGEPVTVRYHALVPLLLNEIQKLTKRVEELEKNLS